MTNALDLPEILYRTGWFLTTHWKSSKKDPDLFDFHPRDLVACTQVNHTWRRVMLPLLWTVYDESRMESWNIPENILQAASEHFRYISLWTPWPANTVRSTHLQELRIAGRALVTNMQLLHNNPQLKLLRMGFSDSSMYSEIQPTIESLTRLQSLQLDFLRPASWDHLTGVFNNNPDLRSLGFSHPLDIMGFEGCEPLAKLTLLHFNGSWDRNTGILHLIQLCPRLERLEFPAAGCPVRQLAKILRESCPSLNAIQCEGGFEFEEEDNAVLLIQTPTRLLHFGLTVAPLSMRICDALVDHAGLESLKLRLREYNAVNTHILAGIFERCTNLRSIDIALGYSEVDYPDPRLSWVDLPWKMPHLEKISLSGLTYPYVSGAQISIALATSFFTDSASRAQRQVDESKCGLAQSFLDQGWAFDHCSTAGYDDRRISDSARAIRDIIFRRVRDSPRMHTIVIEDFTYMNKNLVPLKK